MEATCAIDRIMMWEASLTVLDRHFELYIRVALSRYRREDAQITGVLSTLNPRRNVHKFLIITAFQVPESPDFC